MLAIKSKKIHTITGGVMDGTILIDKGKIRFEGTKDELVANKEVQERFLGV